MDLSLLLVNFVVKLVKFISNFRSIKFFITFKKINNIVERTKCKFIETKIAKINTHTYILKVQIV